MSYNINVNEKNKILQAIQEIQTTKEKREEFKQELYKSHFEEEKDTLIYYDFEKNKIRCKGVLYDSILFHTIILFRLPDSVIIYDLGPKAYDSLVNNLLDALKDINNWSYYTETGEKLAIVPITQIEILEEMKNLLETMKTEDKPTLEAVIWSLVDEYRENNEE